jgi:ribosomal-protein-alanine N-acetyltransferase
MRTARSLIRPMTIADLDEVVRIERTVFTDPWSRALFEQELDGGEGAYALVMEMDRAVAGYIVSWIVLDELHVGNVAVAPARQRRGLARELVQRMIELAVGRGCRRATLEVRVTNEAAISLYRSMGFRPVALRKGYYRDNGEDALIMLAELAGIAGNEPPAARAPGRGSGGRG